MGYMGLSRLEGLGFRVECFHKIGRCLKGPRNKGCEVWGYAGMTFAVLSSILVR